MTGSNRIRVAFVAHHANLSGAARGLYNFAKFIDKQRFAPIVISARDGPLIPKLSQYVPTYVFRRPHVGIRYLGGVIRRVVDPLDRRWFLNLLRGFDPHVLYFNSMGNNRYRKWSRPLSFPKIMHVREMQVFPSLSRSELHEFSEEAQVYIGVAQAITDYLRQDLGIEQEKLYSVYEGIDYQWFVQRQAGPPRVSRDDIGLDENDLLVGGVGAIQPRKGVDLLVDAASKLRARFPHRSLKFIWIGGVSYQAFGEQIKEQIRRLDLCDSFILAGHHDDIVDWLNMVDIVVVPSREEGLPKVICEAMTLGKPIVGSAVAGIPEILGNRRGLLARRGDSESLAQMIGELINNDSLRDRLSEQGRRYAAANLDVSRNIRKIEDVIERTSRGAVVRPG